MKMGLFLFLGLLAVALVVAVVMVFSTRDGERGE